MNHLVPLALALCLLSSAHGQWVLDGDWSGDGRKVEASDRWEVPVSISLAAGEVVLLNAAYDADGQVVPRWRGFTTWGSQSWEGEGEVGERPVDAAHGTAQGRWFMLSEMPAAVGDTLGSLMRVRAFDGSAPVGEWGAEGVVDLTFVGPLNEGGSLDARTDYAGGPQDLWNWLLVSGAAFDSCCAHQEWPALSILSAGDGSYHPDFGQEGRIVLDPDGWQVEDSVRHEFSGRFSQALFVPWNPYESDPNDLDNIRILAGGTYALAGAFQPFLPMFRWDGTLESDFGEGGIMTWFEDANLNHGVRDLRHRWEWLGPDAGVHVLLGTPEGEPTLAGGTMSAGWVPLWPEASPGSSTTSINPGLTTNDPVRSVALAAGFGWKLEDETVVLGTRDIEPGWDGAAHPVWWTGPHMAFGGVNAYWTEDTEFPSQRVGAAVSVGTRLYVAGTLPGDSPATGSWILSRWTEDVSDVPSLQAESTRPFPFPTSGVVEWPCAPGTIQCRDDRGRLLGEWRHAGGRFRLDLPKGAAWLGSEALGWHRVQRLN